MVDKIKIKDIRMLITPYPSCIFPSATADEIAKSFIANPMLKSVYVVDDKLHLLGVITLKTLIKDEFKKFIPSQYESFLALDFIGKKTAKDLMLPPIYVYDDDILKTAFVKMYENDLNQLPVVDKDKKLIGNIDLLEMLTILIEKKEKKMKSNHLTLTINRPFSRDYV
jgi:CBS domain-containing protein